jgi:hypothetical protein
MESTRYSCQILMKPEFADRFWKKIHMSNVIKIHPVAAELFHVDGQTDMIAFHNFVHMPKRE